MISPSLEDARFQSGIASTPANFCERIHAGVTRLIRLWTSLQVSYHGGKYSIERVLALDKYTRTTSLFRVVAVCVVTPLPMVTLVAIQEFLPLQEPQDGWDKNYGFWFRVCMLGAAVSHTYLIQGKYMVDDFAHSSRQVLLFVVGISAFYTLSGIVVAANIVFPIPFYYITMTPAFYAPLLILLYSILGNNTKLNKYVSFIVTQKAMGMLYPLYQLLFRKASDRQYVLPVILLLPVIKVMVKNVVLHFTSHLEDLTPEAVIFTVDFYNALYLATCMESASTLDAMVIFIGTDFAQTVTVLIGMHRRTASVLPRLCQAAGAPPRSNLLSALSLICKNPAIFETQLRGGVQVHSCFQHKLDKEDRHLLNKLEKLPAYSSALSRVQCWSPGKGVVVERPKQPKLRFASFSNSFKLGSAHKLVAVQPIIPSTKRRQGRVAGGPNGIPTDLIEHSNILCETLEVLYTTECLVLTAYLEAFIPLFYCSYMMFMVQLPNAKFHTELSSVTRQNVEYTARVVFLFGLLQVFSFVLLMGLVQRNCKLRILYNLAFVLETQMSLVQGKLMIWMLVTLACRVVHFGADYSFQFKWITTHAH